MNKSFCFLFVCIVHANLQAQNVGIGTTTPNSSAQLDVSSTTKGFLMPRMTTAQRNAITSPAVGLQIFNLDDQCTDIYDGSNWIKTCGLKVTGIITDPGHPTANSWTQKADFSGWYRAGGVGFSIGSKGYLGTGDLPMGMSDDFWEYDPATDAWTQKANFGGGYRTNAVGFSIGSKGYIGTGKDFSFNNKNDFWEYDPVGNAWTQKANFGGSARNSGVGFSIGGKGYIGTGHDGSLKNDFWEYDPVGNAWTQKANFGGGVRRYAVGFSNGSKGYIGTGVDASVQKNDFWEYDPTGNTWTQKANFGGGARQNAVGFSIGSKGYIGTGTTIYDCLKDFWEYDPIGNAWTQKANLSGLERKSAVGFSIGTKGYIGTGTTIGDNFMDFWEYLDNNVTGTAYNSNAISATNNIITDGAWTRTNETVYNANSGNVGIGTGSPSQKLDVNGIINSATGFKIANGAATAGTYLRGNGTNYVASGIQASDVPALNQNTTGTASNVTGVVAIANGGTGSATQNFVDLSTAQTAAGVKTWSNDAIFNGNVGIGTVTPSQKLAVNGNIWVGTNPLSPFTAINNTIYLGSPRKYISNILGASIDNSDDWLNLMAHPGSKGFLFGTSGPSDADPHSSPDALMVIKPSGNVGIGTVTPSQKLDVNGIINSATGFKIANGAATAGTYLRGNGTNFVASGIQVSDVPTLNQNTTGTASNVTGVVSIANGGTGSATQNFVDLSTAQTAAGVKTWSNNAIFNGNVGIGTATPNGKLTIADNKADGAGTFNDGLYFQSTWGGGSWGRSAIFSQGESGYNSNLIFATDGDAVSNFNPTEKVRITGSGNVGIGNTTPNAPLQFSNAVVNRKIVLYEAANNDHQYYGFGINGGILRYQVEGTSQNHVFYAAASSTSSNELMRITGAGNVGIGTSAPAAKLDVNGSGWFRTDGGALPTSAGAGVRLFYGSGGGKIYAYDYTNGVSKDLALQDVGGNVAIGVSVPTARLSVNGNANNTTGAWSVFSDSRVKRVNAEFTDGLNVIRKIRTVKFNYNENAPFSAEGEQIGVVAQELEKLAPYMVSKKAMGDMKDLREVNNQAYPFLLINAVKELAAENEELKKQSEAMKSDINTIKALLLELQSGKVKTTSH